MGFINGLVGHFLEKRYLNDDFSRYISVSNFTKEKLINKIGINKNKIAVVYNGIDLDIFKKTTIDEKYPNPTIVTISRLVPYKRIDDLIRAIKILTSDFPDIKLKIIGKGSQENYLKNLSKNLGIQNNIDFVGKINDKKDLIEILKKSHIFALPSITEGFGIVIIEAIAAGIPYVASDIPSIREVTNSGIGGLLFKPKDYEDLSSKIKILLTDKSKQIEVMKNVNEHLKKYDWNNLACELEDWYKKTFLEFNK